MLAFVTSLRHPQSSVDYRQVERVLERTLHSVCRQQGGDFRVIVVGNQQPSFPLPDKVEFVQVAFPPPSGATGRRLSRQAVLRDKGTKLAVGLAAAQRHRPTHIMTFDADDLVSNRLARLAAANPQAFGWYVETGYVWAENTRVVSKVNRFHRICGTCYIVRADLYPSPRLSADPTQDEVFAGYGEHVVKRLLGSHRHAVGHFRHGGTPLAPLPFPGSVYVLGTGENHSGREQAIFAVPIRARHQREFGLPAVDPGAAMWEAARSFSPVAVGRTVANIVTEEAAAQWRSSRWVRKVRKTRVVDIPAQGVALGELRLVDSDADARVLAPRAESTR